MYIHCDSLISLYWVKYDPDKLKIYVFNSVRKIKDLAIIYDMNNKKTHETHFQILYVPGVYRALEDGAGVRPSFDPRTSSRHFFGIVFETYALDILRLLWEKPLPPSNARTHIFEWQKKPRSQRYYSLQARRLQAEVRFATPNLTLSALDRTWLPPVSVAKIT